MDDYLEAFYLWLQDNSFEPDETKTSWTGSISVEWENVETEEWQTAEHNVTIWLPEGFPYSAPIVFSRDNPPLDPSWHLNPSDPPGLCLWNSETGWKPDFTAHKLLNRIYDWFYYYHTDTWPANSQVPDLHQYLNKIGVVIIGEDWTPPPGISNNQFSLWRSRKFSNVPDIAVDNQKRDEPEPRIVDNIILGSNPRRIKGSWFRVPRPFVPSNRLNLLLGQIDELLQKPFGWSVQKCTEAVGKKAMGEGFPIAVGYPDNLGEERWLFLWGKFPKRKDKWFKWSLPQNLHQIEVESFQTAPASKEALLRRSAYISKSLTFRRVVLFGVGALGSSIALLLAKAGVGELRLIDSDYLMPGNVMRHACGLNYVGFRKTTATELVIKQHNPDCFVECYQASWVKRTLHDYIKSCDLVIDATGNTNFSLYLNQICVECNQPIAFAATYRRARVGRIIMRLDDESPCLACYLSNRRAWSENEYSTIPANPGESFLEDGCGSVTEEAIALDVESVATFVTRQVIKILHGSHDGSNLGIIVNESLPDANTEILSSPGVHFWTNRTYSNCSICRI